MKFELDKEQLEKLNEWKEAIKKIYGEYGNYEYRFKHTGIGVSIKVYNDLADTIIDLTDIDKW